MRDTLVSPRRVGRVLARLLLAAGAAAVVSLCGTAGDPQGRDRQAGALAEAGASVLLSNAAAARLAARLTGGAR